MDVGDYFQSGKRSMSLRLQEKGGKPHTLPAHLTLQRYLDAYLDEAGLWAEKDGPLFRTVNRSGELTDNRLQRRESLAMLKRRAAQAGLPEALSHHWLRATGITEFLEQDGALEEAQQIANHVDSRTTKLYDRRGRKVKQEEIQRLRFDRNGN